MRDIDMNMILNLYEGYLDSSWIPVHYHFLQIVVTELTDR